MRYQIYLFTRKQGPECRLLPPKHLLFFCVALALLTLSGCDLSGSNEGLHSQEEINYFREIAFGSEYRVPREEEGIRRWTQDLRIQVKGESSESRQEVRKVISELNRLVGGVIDLHICPSQPTPDDLSCSGSNLSPNVHLHFVPAESFADYVPDYADGNHGYFVVGWTGAGEIQYGRIYIAVDQPAARHRQRTHHLIREELTQILGLMQDSYTYPESIFYQGYSTVTTYAEIDRALIEMLYRPEIRPGMTREEATAVLRSLER